MKRIVTFLTFV